MRSAAAERRHILAFSKDKEKLFEQYSNTACFVDAESLSIHECGDLIQTAADKKDARQDHRNYASTFGQFLAFVRNASNKNPDISGECIEQILHMYLQAADAPYRNQSVSCTLYTFSKDHPIDRRCMEDLSRLEVTGGQSGLSRVPERLLQFSVGDKPVGLYLADWRMMVPGAALASVSIDPGENDAFMKKNPHTVLRCRAMVTNLKNHGGEPSVLGKVLDRLGGPLSPEEYAVFQAEEKLSLPGNVSDYILGVSPDADPRAVCFLMGTNTTGKMVSSPVFVNTGEAMMEGLNPSFMPAGKNLVLMPPVKNTSEICDISCNFGPLDNNGLPSWIDFAARLDGILCHRVYAGSFSTCRPSYYLDPAFQVPDGIRRIFNYHVAESSAGSSPGLREIQTCWKAYPDDNCENVISLSSRQYSNRWEIIQRSSPIERMELCDSASGEVLATVIPEKAPAFSPSDQTVIVSLDAASSETVRLVSRSGIEETMDLNYRELLHPMTPVSEKEFEAAIEMSAMQSSESKEHIDSLLQSFLANGTGTWSPLMVDSRVWLPDEKVLFEALRNYPGSINEAMNSLGVYNNMKELLTRSVPSQTGKQKIITAFKFYIGNLVLETVLALSGKGYAPGFNNLTLLISYPENGSGEGITRQMKDILDGVISYVNANLTPENHFRIGSSVKLYSESEATAFWHQNHPPGQLYMGENVAVGTPDIGHATLDFSLRAGGRLYMFSLPYGAHRITVSILAKVYDGQPAALLGCFENGSKDLKEEALVTFKKAMESSSVSLKDRLGFTMTLSRLFKSCKFLVTDINADEYQHRVQELTEAKLNAAIPAIAYAIVQALRDGSLKPDDEIYLAPVGKGSLALYNTSHSFEIRFVKRLVSEINYLLARESVFPEGTLYTGQIWLLDNNDKDKLSVAQGMINIEDCSDGSQRAVPVPVPDLTEHYLDLVYGKEDPAALEKKEQFRSNLAALDCPGKKPDLGRMKTELYDNAFAALIGSYTPEDFTESFERFGHTDIGEGNLDKQIKDTVLAGFKNICAQVKKEGKDLIMACPFIEKEMICSALIDLAIDRMDFDQVNGVNTERK